MKKRLLLLLIWLALLCPLSLIADTAPPDRMTTITMLWDIFGKFGNYKVTPIGLCFWLKMGLFPHVVQTLELSEWQPDLVITVFNSDGSGMADGDDAW